MHTRFVFAVFFFTLFATALAHDVPYGVGHWQESGRGNHRAMVQVDAPSDAVYVRIPWRRRDFQPELKAVLVFQNNSAERVANLITLNLNREYGEFIFQAKTAGIYEFYYLPYTKQEYCTGDPGTYYAPEETADTEWKKQNQLSDIKLINTDNLPKASVIAFEARNEFNSFYPMEVIATEQETEDLLAKHPDKNYLVFPEDRLYPIRMFSDLPYRWISAAPNSEFVGKAQPGESYAFQLGIYVINKPIDDISLEYSDLKNNNGSIISSKAFSCINIEGISASGKQIRPQFQVGNKMVRPMWITLDIPKNAKGKFKGVITVKPHGEKPTSIPITINVDGEILLDGGVSDLWRYARLKWLNSNIGRDDNPLPPFTPLVVKKDSIALLNREVKFSEIGLPVSIISNKREVLHSRIAFRVLSADRELSFVAKGNKTLKKSKGVCVKEYKAACDAASLKTEFTMEPDGYIQYSVTLTSLIDQAIKDIRLEVPMKKEVAKYMMGMGFRGGYRTEDIRWKWNINKADNMIWLGDYNAGCQLKLSQDWDVWDLHGLRSAGLPKSWVNDGKGGCEVAEEGDIVMVRAYSGERQLKQGDSLTFRFRLMVTPFRSIDPKHWNNRIGDIRNGANTIHIHQVPVINPYINYPFRTSAPLKAFIKDIQNLNLRTNLGRLEYPAKDAINLEQGSIEIETKVLFDPHDKPCDIPFDEVLQKTWLSKGYDASKALDRNLFALAFPNNDELGVYWSQKIGGLRAYFRKGTTLTAEINAPMPNWKKEDERKIALSWGRRLELSVDGILVGTADYQIPTDENLNKSQLIFEGDFGIRTIKISDLKSEPNTFFFENFAKCAKGETYAQAIGKTVKGKLSGEWKLEQSDGGKTLNLTGRKLKAGVNIYYTIRELSNHVYEMWALRSLGDEIFTTDNVMIYTDKGAHFNKAGGGYPWLKEHLGSGYTPAWIQPYDDNTDASIGTQGISRWHNYYLEGLNWLIKNTGVDGVYLDGIGFDRMIFKRLARTMLNAGIPARTNMHSGNVYDYMDLRISPINQYMEHMPYISNLWLGEMYDYNRSPDYWFVEISGIPFGITSEMLDYDKGGNVYRGMLFGMSGRMHASAPAMWRFWDAFDIHSAEMIGYWDPGNPVKTSDKDIYATVYKKEGQALISLASWAEKTVDCKLTLNWQSLGLNPSKTILRTPYIKDFQIRQDFDINKPIPVEPGKGWLLILEESD